MTRFNSAPCRRALLAGLFFTVVLLHAAASLSAAVLIGEGTVWKYFKGRSEASNPIGNWRLPEFDDGDWARGLAPFRYGDGSGGTVLTDMRSNYTTVFLRKEFNVSGVDDTGALEWDVDYDDGFIVWINGVEVLAMNAPANPRHNATAPQNHESGSVESFSLIGDSRDYLVEGVNVVAVQVFNVSLSSSDLMMNPVLTSSVPDRDPPRVVEVSPAPGLIMELREITVRFSEPVQGVNAGDLLVNETSARSVSGDGETFRFTLPPLELGEAVVTWDRDHGITDRAIPPNAFDARAMSEVRIYRIVDTLPPVISRLAPPAGREVRRFSQVEVYFSEPVAGVDASDLTANGRPASAVSGLAAGPYLFEFDPVSAGPVALAWSADDGIVDLTDAANPFDGGDWEYDVDPETRSDGIVISEIMAVNREGLVDEDGLSVDWIELHNPGSDPVNLDGWTVTDDSAHPEKWSISDRTLGPGEYLILYASAKDRIGGARPDHTNFRLSGAGEYVGLFSHELPRVAVSELVFPEQRTDISYGRTGEGELAYFGEPTPGQANGDALLGKPLSPVRFSAVSGLYENRFGLVLYSDDPGARIRYTMNGVELTATRGVNYKVPLPIRSTTVIQAAAFQEGRIPSRVVTHTYLFNRSASVRSLPTLSIVTANDNLWGPTGIMEVEPRNTTKRGLAWERPASVNWFNPDGSDGFTIECGLRIQGGNYVRERYNPSSNLPFSKYSFRLYFRGDYGASTLQFPIISDSPVQEFKQLVLRAGMNDHSNPFIVDELVRRLSFDTGQVSSRGTFVNLYLNGRFKGYYNVTERIDEDFLHSWHGGTGEWDMIAQFNEVREGDAVAWNRLRAIMRRDMRSPANYAAAERELDMVNFVDYLLLNIYVGIGDWPHNNWRAARERVPGAKWRFYVWDAEWALGNVGRNVDVNVIASELTRSADISDFFQSLRVNPEFKLLFADRIRALFYDDGPLTDEHVSARYEELRALMAVHIPNLNTYVRTTWVPRRRAIVMRQLAAADLMPPVDAPLFSRHGGSVPPGYVLRMTGPAGGTIHFTTDGSDPRGDSLEYTGSLSITKTTRIKARTRLDETWSGLTEALFIVEPPGAPIRISEVMYHPQGGDQFEYFELENIGDRMFDLGFATFDGVNFTFAPGTVMGPGERWVLAADAAAFQARYPDVSVYGTYGGGLSNGGERLALIGADGVTIAAVEWGDAGLWPAAADGAGYSLELRNPHEKSADPMNWRVSAILGGSPGLARPFESTAAIAIEEIKTDAGDAGGQGVSWVELRAGSVDVVDISGWTLRSDGGSRTVLSDRVMSPGERLVVELSSLSSNGGAVLLEDGAGMIVAGVSFGRQVDGTTVAWIDDQWTLGVPTPGTVNEPIALGEFSSVRINEWLANPRPGESDWLEVYNSDTVNPVSIGGGYVQIGGEVAQITSRTFLAPGGFARLWADRDPGWDHMDLKIPAAGGEIWLLDATGTLQNRVVFGAQTDEGISSGRLPDGGTRIVDFAGSSTPGAPNVQSTYTGPRLNELLARSGPESSDWIELHNASSASFDLSGMGLGLGPDEAAGWRFAEGTTMDPSGFLVVSCRADASGTQEFGPEVFEFGRDLPDDGGAVFLFDRSGRPVARIEYGFQVTGRSIGVRSNQWVFLAAPSPGAANGVAAPLGPVEELSINELSANPDAGPDWIELFNPGELPVALHGLFLTDDPTLAGRNRFPIPPLNFIGPHAWVQWIADSSAGAGAGRVNFSLDYRGETVQLFGAGLRPIDAMDVTPQFPGVTRGRLPDGNFTLVDFPVTATPGASNYLPIPGIVFNEVLANSELPFEDAVEIYNSRSEPVDLGGFTLTNDPSLPGRYQIPSPKVVPPNGYLVLYESDLNPDPAAADRFEFDGARGGTLSLSEMDEDGNPTGYRVVERFGPTRGGISTGRIPTSSGFDFGPLASPTFGFRDPSSVVEFRSGTGAPNAGAWIGPVVLHELLIQSDGDEALLEFVELLNRTEQPVQFHHPDSPATGWRLGDGVEFSFPPDLTVPAGAYLVVVRFDPSADAAATAFFRARYGLDASVPLAGPFTGRLSNGGERVALMMPDPPIPQGNSGTPSIPFVTVDHLDYRMAAPWPVAVAGTSLQRVRPGAYGNEPLNWVAAAPTPGAPNRAGTDTDIDTDADGMPDRWELAYALDPLDGGDGILDGDNDGIHNLDEFRSGTNPRDGASRLGWSRIRFDGVAVVLEFNTAPGVEYSVLTRDAVGAGDWSELSRVAPSANGGAVIVTDDRAGDGTRFYRIAVPAP